MNTIISTLTTVLALSITIITAIAALVGTWKTITIITRPIATWALHLNIFAKDEEKSHLESAQAGVTLMGMFLCIFTAGVECAIMAGTYQFFVKFENVHAMVVSNLVIVAGKGVVEGILTLGVLSAVVKGLGLGEGPEAGEVEGKKMA